MKIEICFEIGTHLVSVHQIILKIDEQFIQVILFWFSRLINSWFIYPVESFAEISRIVPHYIDFCWMKCFIEKYCLWFCSLDVLEGCFRSKPSQRCTFSDITSSLRCIKSVQQYAFYLPPALLRAASAPECASRKRPRSALADIRNELPGFSQDLGNCDGPLGLFSRSFNGEMDF